MSVKAKSHSASVSPITGTYSIALFFSLNVFNEDSVVGTYKVAPGFKFKSPVTAPIKPISLASIKMYTKLNTSAEIFSLLIWSVTSILSPSGSSALSSKSSTIGTKNFSNA